MKVYIFFSVYEPLFHAIARELRDQYGVEEFSGFVWGEDQHCYLEKSDIRYRPLQVFTRDILLEARKCKPDLDYLYQCEKQYGVSLNRMIFSERHLLRGRGFEEVLRLVEVTFRLVERTYQEIKPDWIFSEDISCLTSYIHWVVAQGMRIPFYIIGGGKLPYRISVYTNQFQQWERTDALFAGVLRRGLTKEEHDEASKSLEEFLARRERPTGMDVRAQLPALSGYDLTRFLEAARRYYQDSRNPTLRSPIRIMWRRLVRLYRISRYSGIFDRPVDNEHYVLFPLHVQPEASTLVLAPYYLNQLALIEDIAKSLPVGYRLYVKEHMSSQGRRPLFYYRRIRDTFGVCLLGPGEDSWRLLQNAAAVAVITGTMGWEALLLEKPVVTFGKVFYNTFPLVHQAGCVPKDQWNNVFRKAILNYCPDRELLLKYLWCVLQTTYRGFIGNPSTFPQVMESENVKNLVAALANVAGLSRRRTAVSGG